MPRPPWPARPLRPQHRISISSRNIRSPNTSSRISNPTSSRISNIPTSISSSTSSLTRGTAGYGYPDQQYGNQNIVGSFIDQLIGNRYDVSDRQAIRSCGYAAVQEAENRYRPYFKGMPYAYQGYRGHVRVSDISSVQRRLLVTRVKGFLDTTRRGQRD